MPEARQPRTPIRDPPSFGVSAAVVDLLDVSVSVERTPVLRGVTLSVAAGEAVGVVGPNGSGKTTLLRVLSTLQPPVSGTGQVLGARLGSRDVERARPAIALVGHTAALYPSLTLGENLRFYCRLTGRSAGAADAALAAVGLGGATDRTAGRCSHGMLRRAEFARVLVAQPALLLLDEAHAGLDRESAALVDVVVSDVRRRGGGCVVVSHERDRLERTVDRVVEVADGALRPADRSLPDVSGVHR